MVVRKQTPPQFSDYRRYKKYLRLDFERRCAYCGILDEAYGGSGNFAVDHFRPKSKARFRVLICYYPNLYYACKTCNDYKGPVWPSRAEVARGQRFLDPCADEFSEHLSIALDGTVDRITPAGEYTIGRLHLDRDQLNAWRYRKHEKETRLAQLFSLVTELKGSPVWQERRAQHEALLAQLETLAVSLSDDLIHDYGSLASPSPVAP